MRNTRKLAEEQQERLDQVIARYLEDVDRGTAPALQDLFTLHPDLAGELRAFLSDQENFQRLTVPLTSLSRAAANGPTPRPTNLEQGHPLPSGSTLGHYRLESLIGHGGMGSVYRAFHEHLQQPVALKILAPALARDQNFVKRFAREARALARLRHPHIVAIHDMGQQGELYYIVMELVDGVNLRALLQQGKLSAEQALKIVPQVCQALEYAHEKGVVHRDVKPENILIDRHGAAKIADFGLARILHGDEPEAEHLTRTDHLLGTRNYMAPEQWKTAKVDHRADIYAVGVVLYEMLTGQLPVGNFALPSHRRDVNQGIDSIVMRALEQDPEQRYQSASQLATAVSDVLTRGSAIGSFDLVDQRTGKTLGHSDGPLLRITSSDDETIKIHGWHRQEVGISGDEDALIKVTPLRGSQQPGPHHNRASAPPLGVEVTVKGEPVTIYVPSGLSVEVQVPEAQVFAQDVQGDLTLWAGESHAKIARHRGRLRIERTDGGKVDVRGLVTSALELRTQSGSILVTELEMSEGSASVQSLSGDLDVQILPELCSLQWEVRTVSGQARVDSHLNRQPQSSPQRASGSLRDGRGRLYLSSNTGHVKLETFRKQPWHSQTTPSVGTILAWLCIGWLILQVLF